jgi:membrane fusion protein (multidrug efflux system)
MAAILESWVHRKLSNPLNHRLEDIMATAEKTAPEITSKDKAPNNLPPHQNGDAKPAGAAPQYAAVPAAPSGDGKAGKKRNMKPILLAVGIPLVLLGGIVGYKHYRYAQWHVATDDAYLTSDVVQITPQVAGRLTQISVTDNQLVRAGDTLALLDNSTYESSVEEARANLAIAVAAENAALQNVRLISNTGASQIVQAQGGVNEADSGIGAAQSGVVQSKAGELNAQAAIVAARDNAEVARAAIATSVSTRDRAIKTAQAAKTQISAARARFGGAGGGIAAALANVRAAQSGRAQTLQAVSATQAQLETARSGVSAAQAQIAVARAQLASAQAQAERSSRELTRANELFTGGAAPRSSVDTAQAAQKSAQASVEQAEAQIRAAEQALNQAQSNVTARQAEVSSARQGTQSADAQIGAARAALTQARQGQTETGSAIQNAQAEYEAALEAVREAETGIAQNRARAAAARDTITQAQAALQQSRAATGTATQNVNAARGKALQAKGQLDQARTAPDQLAVAQANYKSAHAKVLQAQAALHTAQINLDRTRLVSPVTGFVSKRNAQLGQQVAVGAPILAIVPKDDIWVTANYKETQLGHVRPGQHVEIEVDSFPGHEFSGHVQSIAAGTGSTFALLPPDNASGNFTKVVQRVPVKITFDKGQKDLDRLRAGMSALPNIETK